MEEVSVYIPKQSVLDEGGNFLEILRAIPAEEIKKKQLAIEQLAPTLQYSVVSVFVLLCQCFFRQCSYLMLKWDRYRITSMRRKDMFGILPLEMLVKLSWKTS